jgi:UDP-N-acetylglucosamine 2-epimerase (non-hydrolysing)
MIKKKAAVVVGARPNFVKCACLLKEFEKNKECFDYYLIHTGQHYDYSMAGVFFEELEIKPPDVHLKAVGMNHVQTIAMCIRKLCDLFSRFVFDYVIVFGDVNSTLACAIASAKHSQHLVHVEAGLRSHDRRMPEEINRAITDHVSDIHFTSELSANKNLELEAIPPASVHLVGNIMIDTLVYFSRKIDTRETWKKLDLPQKKYILSTVHRQENVDDKFNLKTIFQALHETAKKYRVVLPLHPRTKGKLQEFGLSHLLDNLTVIEPQSYLNFTNLVKHSLAVITDSGGIQEEASYLDIPCMTLRDNTERPVTIELGTNTLVGLHTNHSSLLERILKCMENPKHRQQEIPLWDGKTSRRIIEVLKRNVNCNHVFAGEGQ